MVLAAFVQPATVLNRNPRNFKANVDPQNNNPLYLSANLSPAPHTSTCGHVMHSQCWQKFFDNVMMREHRRPYRLRHPTSFDVDKQEFLCPLCECLSNTVLPMAPSLSKLQQVETDNVPDTTSELSFDEFLKGMNYIMQNKNKVCHGIFKCNTEECGNIHCTACIDASSGTTIDQDSTYEECDVNCVLQPHQVFYATPLDKSDATLGRSFTDMFLSEVEVDLNPQLQEMIQVFAQITYTRGLSVSPHPSDKRLVPMAWKSLAYSTRVVETVTAYQGKPLLGALTSRQRDLLDNLVKEVALLGNTWAKNEVIKSHALNLLSILLEHHDSEDSSVLDFDSFGYLVSLTFSLPSIFVQTSQTPVPSGGCLEWHTLRLMFVLNIVKSLLDLGSPLDTWFDDDSVGQEIDEEVIGKLLQAVFRRNPPTRQIAAHKVWEFIKEQSKSFLRCCVLFYHYLTEIPASSCLQEVGGDTFENMCAYLDLPTAPEKLFGSEQVQALIEKWTSHLEVLRYNPPARLLTAPRLIELPEDYSELINQVPSYICPNSEEEYRNPTMCLVCGTVLCSLSYCCQTDYKKIAIGACNTHAIVCGAGVGIFLRIRDCELLLLATPHRGCFLPAPYLDEHGEADQGLRRGNPLKLNQERYEKLHMMWLNHTIHEEIARQIETTNHIVATQWNLL